MFEGIFNLLIYFSLGLWSCWISKYFVAKHSLWWAMEEKNKKRMLGNQRSYWLFDMFLTWDTLKTTGMLGEKEWLIKLPLLNLTLSDDWTNSFISDVISCQNKTIWFSVSFYAAATVDGFTKPLHRISNNSDPWQESVSSWPAQIHPGLWRDNKGSIHVEFKPSYQFATRSKTRLGSWFKVGERTTLTLRSVRVA